MPRLGCRFMVLSRRLSCVWDLGSKAVAEFEWSSIRFPVEGTVSNVLGKEKETIMRLLGRNLVIAKEVKIKL